MAELLHRLGTISTRHAIRVAVVWAVALAAAVTAYLLGGGDLTSGVAIPGTATQQVADELATTLPDLAGVTATAVFSTDDGSTFTADQRSAISGVLDELRGIDRVRNVVDPFTAQDQLTAQTQQLADGAAQLESARTQLDTGQAQLDAARSQLEGQAQQLDGAIAQAQAAGATAQVTQLQAQRTQLDAASAQLDQQQAQITAGLAQLEEQSAQLEAGQRLADAAQGIRTVSADGSTAVGAVMFADDMFSLPPAVRSQVADALDAAHIPGVRVDYSSEIATNAEGLLGPGEVTGVVIAGLVLLIMLRTLLGAALPLVSSLVGVGIGVSASMAFSSVVDMSSVTPILGVMLGLAVGIDYSLFLLHRHRRQLRTGMEVDESIALANGTSGTAVVFAGSTVIVALLALGVTGIPFLAVMGVVGAVCVAVAVLVAITLTPALLHLLGRRVLGRGRAHTAPAYTPRPMRTVRQLGVVAVSVVALLVLAIPALSLRLGLPDGSSEATDSTQYRAYTTVAQKFGAGQNGPLLVVATTPAPVAEADALTTQADIADELKAFDDVVAVAPVGTANGTMFAFQVVPADGPSSVSTADLVHALRDASPLPGDVTLGVAGQASGNIDVAEKLGAALPGYLVVVVGLSLLIMIVVLRSLLVPLVATLGFVLSFLGALGGVVAIYQWGWLPQVFGVHDPGPVLSFVPLILVGVLFGLAMDYQLFLVSGMREAYAHGAPARTAVVAGRHAAIAVVTAAAIIMTSVFGGFMFSHLAMVRPLGFGLAFGVLLDAFVVRMALVPALMHLAGDGAWWLPRWLDRVLPKVDIEGAALERSHPVHGTAAEPAPEASV